ncbi:MAG: SIS domain-containing protein [Dehalococcoidia bacterium]
MTNAPGVDETSVLAPAMIDAVIAKVDGSRFHALLEALPDQSRQAWALGRSSPLPPAFHTPSRIVLLGLGGSAAGGDIVAALAGLSGGIPVEVVRNYRAPRVDADTLVVACSFSGNTEEVIEAFSATLDAPGMRLAMTTGGRLGALAAERGVPLITYAWDGPPRTALGYSLFTLLAVLGRLHAIAVTDAEVEAALAGIADATARYGIATTPNEAKQAAILFGKRLPVIIGTDFLGVAAQRFAAEVSENAKQWAFATALPEFDHNMLQSLGSPGGMPHAIAPIILDTPAAHPRNRRRAAESYQLLLDVHARAQLVDVGGASPLEAIVRATTFASWTSYYLALLQGADPTPVEVIDLLKERMAEE